MFDREKYLAETECEVCGCAGIAGVASSVLAPYSAAYCRRCLEENADCYWLFIYMYYEVGQRGEGIADWVKQLRTYRDGHYVTWAQFDALQREYCYLEEPLPC
jgi:hypothetical protein